MRMTSGLRISGVRRLTLAIAATFATVSFGLGQNQGQTFLPLPMSAAPPGAASAVRAGRMAETEHLNISVSLQYRDPAGMQQFVNSVSDRRNPLYRHFISPAEVGKRFGPTPDTIQKVENYLTRQGMTVKFVGSNGLSILVDGTVAQAEAAFQTEIGLFTSSDPQYPAGQQLFSYVAPPSLPAAIQPYVIDIGGLENFTHPKPLSYITPNQIQTLYNVAPMYNAGSQGQGRTIAISSWDGYRLSNVSHEYSQFGLPTPGGGVGSNISIVTLDGGSGSGNEEGEADLDIQSILGVAPLCHLIIYDGAGGDLISVLTQEADDNKADIISESYGWTLASSTALAAHNLHLSMSAEGITYMAASGDSGTTLNYYYPDIEPEVLLVGGTTCSVDAEGNRLSEVAWSGSGGGWKPTSDPFNVLPSYQTGTGVPTNIPYRLLPDVALNADPNSGYVVYVNGGFYVIGGTSGASPTFAGSLGVSEEQLITNGAINANGSGNYRMGRLNDLVYSFNGDSSVFYDVTQGSNGNLPNGSGSTAGTGWDFTTGWGAMNFNGFVTALSGSGLAQFTLSPATVEGGTATVTGTVSLVLPAPSGGTAITISGGDSSISYPTTVTVPAGSRSATFSITSSAVTTVHTESLSAVDGSTTKNATLTVTPTAIASFTFSPTTGLSGNTFTGTVTLVHAAAASGDTVALTGGDSHVSHPASVTVPAGATSASFSMTSTLSPTNDVETVTATLGTSTKSSVVTLTGLAISTFTLSPAAVTGGASATGVVTLSAAAGASGATIALSGGDSTVSYPATLSIPANGKTASFTVRSSAVSSTDAETLTATFGASSKAASLTVNPPSVTRLTFVPASIFGGQSSQGTVTLSGPAGASGLSVSLSGGDSSLSYPSSVTVPSGASTATFAVTSSIVQTTDSEVLTATLGTSHLAGTLTLKPEGILSSLTFAPSSIVGGKTSIGTVRLASAAGPTGVVVSLSGGDSSISYPSSVSLASGQVTATFTVTSSVIVANDTETVTATLGPTTVKGSLLVQALKVSSLTLSPNSVFGGQSSTGTVTLNGPAGSSGATVALSGGDSSVSYPSSVTVASGATTATFSVSSSVVQASDIEALKATLNSVTTPGTLTLKPEGVVSSITFSPASVIGGGHTTGTVRLTSGAGPTGVVVSLSGGDSSISYPTTVAIAAGVSSATFSVTTSAVSANDIEALTGTLGASTARGSLTVTAASLSSIALSSSTTSGGSTFQGTVSLNGVAGPSGAVVALSGGDGSVAYPSTVTVPAGSSTVTFSGTTTAVTKTTSETITARLNGSAKSVSLKLTAIAAELTRFLQVWA